MKLNLPKIELNKSEEIWALRIWQKIKKKEKISYKIMRVELVDKLPDGFDPKKINKNIVQFGEEITLIGIHILDPNFNILKKSNTVVKTIKQQIIKNPELETIEATLISDITDIPVSEVSLILKVISLYGYFWTSASGSQNSYGYESVSFSNDNGVFDQYLTFTSIEKLINEYYESKRKKAVKQSYYGNTVMKTEKRRENIFGSKIEQVDISLCFVLMPFTEVWSDRVFKRYIRENIESMGLQCLRADNLTGQIIIEDIWVKINQAAFIIADVTGRNPNVMYELGIAHTLGKPVILITQEIDKIPFDFTHLRHYVYVDNVTGQEKFSNQLKSVIPEIYKDYYPDQDKFLIVK